MISLDINKIRNLCIAAEEAVGYPLRTPRDFNRLSEDLFNRMREMVSASTLMRLWGYIDSSVKPRIHTLTLLSRFVGYRDWNAFCTADTEGRQSSVVICRRLNVATDITRGQRLRLRWLPNRVCDVRYLGNLHFEVENSENTGLKKGATFMCPLIIEGEPLYLDDVKQLDIPGSGYVCGKRNGITFAFRSTLI